MAFQMLIPRLDMIYLVDNTKFIINYAYLSANGNTAIYRQI